MSEFRMYSGRRPNNGIKNINIAALTVITAVCAAFILLNWFGSSTRVIGSSMQPKMASQDTAYIDRLDYLISSPDRFDVIAFERDGVVNIKRIIGLPGDTVQITDGKIYVNGEALDYQWSDTTILYSGLAEDPVVLGLDEYFVVGDNFNSSEDSRSETIGNIKENEIIGRVWLVRG